MNRNDAPATAIHGIRIYLKSVKLHRSRDNTPIYVHGRLSDQWSDLYYIFRPLAERWRGHFLTTDFGIMIGDDCRVVDPLPSLAEQFGKGLLEADVKTQLAILSGDEFPQWGPGCRDAALLPVFVVRPKIEVARDLFWSQTFRLTTRTWPRETVLDKHHLIWICPFDNGEDVLDVSRIGVLLDAVENAKHIWPIDPARVYLTTATWSGSVAAAAFYYPEVFHGMIQSIDTFWFGPGFNHPYPRAEQWNQARDNGRFFIANRKLPDPKHDEFHQAILRDGYQLWKFRHVKMIDVPRADMDHYFNFAGGWFDQGIDYLDSTGP